MNFTNYKGYYVKNSNKMQKHGKEYYQNYKNQIKQNRQNYIKKRAG